MNIRILQFSASVGLVLGMSMPVAAQTMVPAPGELTVEHYQQLDYDQDGRLSRDEFLRFINEAFDRLDADRDRRLTQQETQEVLTPEQFSAVDKNADRYISLDELIEHVMREFDHHDYDKDGYLQLEVK